MKTLAGVSILVIAAAAGGGCVSVKSPQIATRPATADALLRLAQERWSGAALAPAGSGSCAAQGNGVVAGDFNGDGYVDAAARVTTPDGVHLVAAIVRTEDDQLVDVAKLDDANANLVLHKQGVRYFLPTSKVDLYFGTDTLAVSNCGPIQTAYTWNGVGFSSFKVAMDASAVTVPPAPAVPSVPDVTSAPPAASPTSPAAPSTPAAPAPSSTPAQPAAAQPNSAGTSPASR